MCPVFTCMLRRCVVPKILALKTSRRFYGVRWQRETDRGDLSRQVRWDKTATRNINKKLPLQWRNQLRQRLKEVCRKAMFEEVCRKATSEEVCKKARPEEVYRKARFEEVCRKARFEEVCRKTRSEEVCRKTRSEEVCRKASFEEVCRKTRFEEVCRKARSEEVCPAKEKDYTDPLPSPPSHYPSPPKRKNSKPHCVCLEVNCEGDNELCCHARKITPQQRWPKKKKKKKKKKKEKIYIAVCVYLVSQSFASAKT